MNLSILQNTKRRLNSTNYLLRNFKRFINKCYKYFYKLFEQNNRMNNIILEIESALRMGLCNIALQSTLAIPDICGALNSKDGQASGPKYKDWFNENVPTLCDDYLDGEVVYILRCSLLHQGKFTHPKQKYDRIIFQLPNKNRIVIHKMITKMNGENVLTFNLNTFCEDILLSAKIWSFRNKDSENYKNNSTNLIQTNNDGYNNIVKGLPIIF